MHLALTVFHEKKTFDYFRWIVDMAARQEYTPIPSLSGYTFGEKLGAGSYGRIFI